MPQDPGRVAEEALWRGQVVHDHGRDHGAVSANRRQLGEIPLAQLDVG